MSIRAKSIAYWLLVVALLVVGLVSIAADVAMHAFVALGRIRGTAVVAEHTETFWPGVGALATGLLLARLGDEIATEAKPLVELLRPFLPWGKKSSEGDS